MTDYKIKLSACIIVIITLNAWNRFGNFSELFNSYGIRFLQYLILAVLIGIAGFLFWKGNFQIMKVIIIVMLSILPVSYLFGNGLGVTPSIGVAYPIILITILLLFRRELMKFPKKDS